MEVCTNGSSADVEGSVLNAKCSCECVKSHTGFSVVLYKTQQVYRENHSIFFFQL